MSTLPYGSWPSPIGSERVAAGALRLSQPQISRGLVCWLEGRPAEAGRQAVMGVEPEAAPVELSPPGLNVRSVVHEYGGGDYLLRGDRIYYVALADGAIRATSTEGRTQLLVTPAAGARYADFDLSPDGRWLVAVEERHREAEEAVNRIVAFCLAGSDDSPRMVTVAEGCDFASFPRFSPDGTQLAYTCWDHPDMPWDATRLRVLPWDAGGPSGDAREVTSGQRESIFQPRFSPEGILTFVSDRTGWWNLYQDRGPGREPRALCPREAEFGRPQWVFGMSSYAFLEAGRILCSYVERGRDHLARLDPATGDLEAIELPLTSISGVQAEADVACFVGAGPTAAPGVYHLDLATGELRQLRSSLSFDLDEELLSLPEEIEFPTTRDDTAHAFFYPPHSPRVQGPPGERPPLLVKTHGGPTAAASSALDLRTQYWTSRGFAVVDVNYRGSTGYGRAYRERLLGQWGVVDVEDCMAAARYLADSGRVDPERLVISGGSAGGYTALCALTFHDLFRAGASHYGVGDLEALVRDTHKFESRYTDSLVGPHPERRDLYVERSPIHFAERLTCPMIFFQGLEDRVVPPNQAETMVAALAERGIPHAYVAFPGEQHGFRQAENIRTALDGELYFYSQVFGFEVEERPEAVQIAE